MNKGCLIALAVFAALIAIGATLFFVKGLPAIQKLGTAAIILSVESAIADYTAEVGSPPEGADNAAIMKALGGENSSKKNFIPVDMQKAVIDGQMIDAFANPLILERTNDGKIKVSSAGKNKIPGDSDDVTSDDLPAEAKAEIEKELGKE